MSYSELRKLRLPQSTKLSLLVKANSTRKGLQSATPIPTPTLFVRFLKTALPETMLPPITIDRLPDHTAMWGQEPLVARHSPSTTMAPVAIVAIEEEGTTIVVEASICQVTTEGASNSQ